MPLSRPPSIVAKLICGLALLIATTVAAAPGSARAPVPGDLATTVTDAATRYYTMLVRFRPFLFWMTREDVGGARISWSGDSATDRSVELLVGSDPDSAPMSINRWGFISEQTLGDTARLVGVMTDTDDRTIDAARANPHEALNNGRVFRAIRTTVHDNEVSTATTRLVVGESYSYRHYADLMRQVPATDGGAQRMRISAGTEPGFLTAMKALVHDSVERWQAHRLSMTPGLQRDYVYMGKIYSVSLKSAPVVSGTVVAGRTYTSAIDGDFEIRNTATGNITSFEMLYGVTGAEREAPLRLVYRPRWWVELQLLLIDPSASKMAMAGLGGGR